MADLARTDAAPHGEQLLVADSFRVRANHGSAEVRGLELHVERFRTSVRAASGGSALDTDEFLADAHARIAAFGAGFPRWELWQTASGAYEHRLSLRPLPTLNTTIDLVTVGHVPLEHPERKGPNIPRFAELNRRCGAEAVLLAPNDTVREGTTTTLVWWEGATLCTSASTERVQSITELLILDTAEAFGIRHERREALPSELHGHELWAVNALHGIRDVQGLDGVRMPAPHAPRLTRFRAALDETWTPLAPPVLH